MGLETEIIGPEEIAKIAPVTNVEGILGGLYDPLDGHLDPSGTTHAYAKAARMGGAEIVLHTKVLETNPRPDGTWDVVTDKGTIHAEHVVNAAGLWAREVGHMAGIELPLHPMEHQYLVTDDIPEIYERGAEHPHVMDPAGESYLRQEGRGLCIGFYEQTCRPWAVDGTPWEFGHELLPDDFDKIEDSIAFAYRRFPVLERAGVKSVIHGPFTFAPDGNPLVGPVPGLRNYWSACGVMAGFSQGGGVGLTLAQWMVEGEPERDVFAMDVARFGRFLTPAYTLPKVVENYQTRFSVSYPNEEKPAARPLRTTPMYDVFDAMGAVWGQQYGLEVANYFAEPGEPRYETPSFRRSNAWDATAREVAAVRGGVGINEVQNFGKYTVRGPNARAWLDRIMAGRVPQAGAPVAVAHAGAVGADHGGFHHLLPWRGRLPPDRQLRGAGFPHALVRRPHGGRGHGRERLGPDHGIPDRGAARARSSTRCGARGRVGHALPRCASADHRAQPGRGAAGQLHRRSGLRDLCRRDGTAPALVRAVGGGRAPRPETLRHARDDEPAPRPVLRVLDAGVLARLHRGGDRARPVRGVEEERGFHRPRGGGGGARPGPRPAALQFHRGSGGRRRGGL
jgi:glycine/D-amino acid oxidase-like deaminating enzyme